MKIRILSDTQDGAERLRSMLAQPDRTMDVAIGYGDPSQPLGLINGVVPDVMVLDAFAPENRNRSLSGVLLQPPSARNNPSHIHQGGAGSDQGDSDQQQVAAA